MAGQGGLRGLLWSWQLWVPLIVAAAAPLNVSLPVIASLDRLLGVALGVIGYGERLQDGAGVLVTQGVGLTMLDRRRGRPPPPRSRRARRAP